MFQLPFSLILVENWCFVRRAIGRTRLDFFILGALARRFFNGVSEGRDRLAASITSDFIFLRLSLLSRHVRFLLYNCLNLLANLIGGLIAFFRYFLRSTSLFLINNDRGHVTLLL